MKVKILIIALFMGLLLPQELSAQKTRVLSVSQMIDQGKFEEGRDAIELALWNEKTAKWHRTHFTKGLLCQRAFEEGYKKKDEKLMSLYPDQLYVAYESYEKALELDVRARMKVQISQNYYNLSNDFRKVGSDHFKKGEFKGALRAFEHALFINNSDLVNTPVDTNLVCNTAIAAYESKDWSKAVLYLTGLHDIGLKSSFSILLYQTHLENGDSTRAEEVLIEALGIFNYDHQVVAYLVNFLVQSERAVMAIEVLDEAIARHPGEYRFYWERGLIYRRMMDFESAIDSFKKAAELDPEDGKLYYHLGLLYYNRGIELQESARGIRANDLYRRTIEEARQQFMEALNWLEKSYEKNPEDTQTISRLHQLYYQLQMKEKEESMKQLLQ